MYTRARPDVKLIYSTYYLVPCTKVSIHSVAYACQAEGEIRRDRSQPVGYSIQDSANHSVVSPRLMVQEHDGTVASIDLSHSIFRTPMCSQDSVFRRVDCCADICNAQRPRDTDTPRSIQP
eukprot:3132966-Pyramimonas_sp.AAC.1